MKQIQKGQTVIPFSIEPTLIQGVLEITTRCNVLCDFCPNIHDKKRYHCTDWSYDDFLLAFPHIAECRRVIFCCAAGEPFLNKDMHRMLKHLKQADIQTGFFTNGQSLANRDRLRKVLDYTDFIEWSIVSFEPEIQEKWMKGTRSKDLSRNMSFVTSEYPKLDLGLAILLMSENISTLSATVSKAIDHGVKRIRLSPVRESGLLSMEGKTYNYFSKEQVEVLHKEVEKCRQLPASISFADLMSAIQPPPASTTLTVPDKVSNDDCQTRVCTDPWRSINIYATGLTTLCCYRLDPVGNIFENPDNQVFWNNSKYADYRAGICSGKLKPMCKTCGMRVMGSIDQLKESARREGLVVFQA